MDDNDAARDALAERLLEACIGGLDLLNIYVGEQLGLYQRLASDGPLTVAQLAERCGIHERYAQEWLEQQAIAGILTIDPADKGQRRFGLPAGHAEVLVDQDGLAYLAPLGQGLAGVARALPEVLDAFRGGGGVPFASYGEELRSFIARVNRPMFINLLAQDWFPRVPGLVERLSAEPSARVADVGCGSGWSSIAIARGFPLATVVGLDLDDASIGEARANATASGVADRVTFEIRDAADPRLAGTFDLVCAFETIHDMCDPTGGLAAMRSLRAPTGTVLVADERVADTFTVDVDFGERFQWGWSALHCLPTAMVAPPAAGTGTVMRTPTFRKYAQDAGFSDIEVLPIDNDFWRFYRLLD
ncbi:MAG: class I SAM-dependent methyltransferase [Acidimicrobiales bacterium]